MSENLSRVLQHLSLGSSLNEQGLPEDAVQCYREGLAICPDNAELWFNLGNSFLKLSKLSDAVEALQQAIALKPDFAGAYINLGNALNEQGLSENAIQCYRNGLAVCPGNAHLWYNLGTALIELPNLPEALQALQQAIALKPDLANAYINLGHALKQQGLPENAIQYYRQGLAICPDDAQLWFSLGTAFLELQKHPEAVEALQQTIACQPDFADAYTNLGIALQYQGKVENAIIAYNQALTLDSKNPEIYHNRSLAILLSGDLARGFAEYEWRRKANRYRHSYDWCDDRPQWCGEYFSGKRLLIFHEQGYGDALQFCRYLPLVKARGGIVQFSAPQPLLRLFGHLSGIDELIEHTPAAIFRTHFDLAVPLLSLPHIFGTTLPTIPSDIPYLTADQHCINIWQDKMKRPGSNLRVGLVWAGNPKNIPWQIRTCGLQAMSPLASISGVTFYSLQKGEAAGEAATPPPGMRLIDLTDDIDDFADTAALIMNLDLIIAVDTSVAHLAGALGKPVWTLLPAINTWRWLMARNDSPWYPTMRLFRQSAPGDWTGVMTTVAQELSHAECERKLKYSE